MARPAISLGQKMMINPFSPSWKKICCTKRINKLSARLQPLQRIWFEPNQHDIHTHTHTNETNKGGTRVNQHQLVHQPLGFFSSFFPNLQKKIRNFLFNFTLQNKKGICPNSFVVTMQKFTTKIWWHQRSIGSLLYNYSLVGVTPMFFFFEEILFVAKVAIFHRNMSKKVTIIPRKI